MGFGGEWASWLTGDSGGVSDGAVLWAWNARLAANGVILAANAYVAWVLYRLVRHGSKVLPPPRLVMLFAALVALGGVTHLVILDVAHGPVWLVPTALKVTAAGLWLAVAVELPAVVGRLSRPLPRGAAPASSAPSAPGANDEIASMASELDRVSRRLRDRVEHLESMLRDETWHLDKADALHELRAILNDLGAKPCKT